MSWKVWLGAALTGVVAGSLCLVSPRLGAIAVILLALGTVAAFASRLL